MKERSRKQQARQRPEHRDHGKYAKVNPCYHCGKSAGTDYCSHRETDGKFGDEGLVLCNPCCIFLEFFTDDEALRRLRLSNYGQNPQPRK